MAPHGPSTPKKLSRVQNAARSLGADAKSTCDSNWATTAMPSQPYGARLCLTRTPKLEILLATPNFVPWSKTDGLKTSAERSIDPYSVTVVLSINGVRGPAFTGMPAIVGLGFGAGETATEPCRTGLPLNLLGSVTGAAGAAAIGFAAADRLRTFARSSAFSFSILSSRAITSSSVADRAAQLNKTRRKAAKAVPDRSLFLMTFPQRSKPTQLSSEGSLMYTKCQLEGLGGY